MARTCAPVKLAALWRDLYADFRLKLRSPGDFYLIPGYESEALMSLRLIPASAAPRPMSMPSGCAAEIGDFLDPALYDAYAQATAAAGPSRPRA